MKTNGTYKAGSWHLTIPTAEGTFGATYSPQGLCSLSFPQSAKKASTGHVSRAPEGQIPAQVQAWHQVTAQAVKSILQGKDAAELPPIDLSSGTEFQQSVWRRLLQLKSGATISYAGLAAQIGRPRATRAVGSACGANHIPLLIPCHRVLASGSRLGGFSGGLDWKQTLLSREGVACKV